MYALKLSAKTPVSLSLATSLTTRILRACSTYVPYLMHIETVDRSEEV